MATSISPTRARPECRTRAAASIGSPMTAGSSCCSTPVRAPTALRSIPPRSTCSWRSPAPARSGACRSRRTASSPSAMCSSTRPAGRAGPTASRSTARMGSPSPIRGVEANIRDGDTVAMEGFTHLIPHAAGHEVIRQRRKRLTLIRMTPDLIYDQLIGMGCADKAVFSWCGNPGVGSLHRMRDAIENGWPQPLAYEEHSHAAMANAYEAGAAGLPFAVFRGYIGVDLPKVNPNIRSVTCPYTGEKLAAVPAIRPDVAIIHALRADRAGNAVLEGVVGVQKQAVLAAKRSIVTVEEMVDDFGVRSPNAVILPSWTMSAIVVAPGGAHPSYAHGSYKRDNAYYKKWDEISRERDGFLAWMKANVLDRGPEAFAEQRRRLSFATAGAA